MHTKIMIIDAHPVYAPKMAGFLESLTLKDIVVVARGQKALEAVGEYKPDVIILSATLPDYDSTVLAGQIKSLYPSVAMIVQTGLLSGSQVIQAFKSAGVEYIVPRLEKDWSAFQYALTEILAARSI